MLKSTEELRRELADLQREYDRLESSLQYAEAQFRRRLEQGGVFHIELKVRDEWKQPIYDSQTVVFHKMEEIKSLLRNS